MSRGTTLTLYKKYDYKMNNTDFKSVVKKYAENNKEHDYSPKKKSMKEYSKDIPIIMNINPFLSKSCYDEKTKTWFDPRPAKTIDTIKNNAISYVDSRDKMYCERMMEWSFGSSFDCLVELYNIGQYNYSGCAVEIDEATAQKMLEAINYILSGNWSDNIESALNNSFINTFTTGYSCDSYWKYVYRNKNSNKKVFSIKKDGYDITIKCPDKKDDSNDDEYYAETEESNSSIEHSLNLFKYGLTTFLYSDNWLRPENTSNNQWFGYDDKENYKYILIYEYWG